MQQGLQDLIADLLQVVLQEATLLHHLLIEGHQVLQDHIAAILEVLTIVQVLQELADHLEIILPAEAAVATQVAHHAAAVDTLAAVHHVAVVVDILAVVTVVAVVPHMEVEDKHPHSIRQITQYS